MSHICFTLSLQEDCVPRDLLLSAMALRLSLLDHPEKLLPPTLPLVLQQQQAMQYGLHLSLAGSPTGPGSGAYGQGPLGALGASSAPQVVHSGTQSCVGPLPSPTASQADSGPLSTGAWLAWYGVRACRAFFRGLCTKRACLRCGTSSSCGTL